MKKDKISDRLYDINRHLSICVMQYEGLNKGDVLTLNEMLGDIIKDLRKIEEGK